MSAEEPLDEDRLFHEVTRVVRELESIHRGTVLELAASRSELAAARAELAECHGSLDRHVLSAPRPAHAVPDDLLDVSVGPAVPAGEAEVDLWTVVAGVVARLELIAHQAGVHVLLEPELEPGRFVVPGTVARWERLVEHLASNAVRFTPQGGQVTLGLLGAADFVELRVQDSGAGAGATIVVRLPRDPAAHATATPST